MPKHKPFGRRGPSDEIQWRSKYSDPSRRFLDWVQGLGIEKTIFGRVLAWLDDHLGLRRLAGLLVFSLLLSSVIFSEIDFTYSARLGGVASTDIKSPVNLELVDSPATEEKQKEAEQDVPPVFDFDPNVYERLYDNIYRSFMLMRREYKAVDWPAGRSAREEAMKEFMVHQDQFERELGRPISARLFEWLVEKHFAVSVENSLIQALAKWSAFRSVEGPQKYLSDRSTKVIVRVVKGGVQGQEFAIPVDQLRDTNSLADFNLDGVRGLKTLDSRDQKNLMELAHSLLMPNLTYNLKETDQRRLRAREGVLPVQRRVQKNQMIVSEGQIIQPIHMAIISEIREMKNERRTTMIALAAALLFVTLILVFLSYLRRYTANRVVVSPKDLLTMGAVTLFTALVTKVFVFLMDQAVTSRFGTTLIPESAFLYLAPVAAAPMLVGLLITSAEVVWLFTIFVAAILAIMVDMNFGFLLVTIAGGIAAGRGVNGCKQRNDIYRAGVRVGLVNATVVSLLTLMQQMGNADLFSQLAWNLAAGFFSGVLAAMVTMGVVPLLESWFNYTTDIKLLELASLNHPLMKEMIVKAPGTYHHSLVVGSMCEAAAEEIGANPLLAKVMAYYHDIGKTEHAQYFIENQRPGQNPHDHISPNMSKTVLIAHVKDGAELGYQYRLGQPIIDGVLQHHGTTLISYFYNKALEEQDQDIDQVVEEDFRYPGPKPQFREAALVMLADSIEAAARSLDEPTTARLQNIVKNVIQNKFLDGQLEECNLTLRDLTVIETAFKRVLLGIYHQRIDYPMKYSATRTPPVKSGRGDKKGSFSA